MEKWENGEFACIVMSSVVMSSGASMSGNDYCTFGIGNGKGLSLFPTFGIGNEYEKLCPQLLGLEM